ncbi:hypothetical protein V8E36_003488 [Tilletia maclaganii]
MLAASARPVASLRSHSASHTSAFHVWSPTNAAAPSSAAATPAAVSSPSSSASSSSTRSSFYPSHDSQATARSRRPSQLAIAGSSTSAPRRNAHTAQPPSAGKLGSVSNSNPTGLSVSSSLTHSSSSSPLFHGSGTATSAGQGPAKTGASGPASSPMSFAFTQQSRWLRASPSAREAASSPDSSSLPPSPRTSWSRNTSAAFMTSVPSQFNTLSNDGQDDSEQAWAFGGGGSSRGGPINEGDERSAASGALQHKRRSGAEPVIVGSAGKGAISGYGRRRSSEALSAAQAGKSRSDYQSAQSIWQINFGVGAGKQLADASKSSVPGRDQEDERIASEYVHKYSPSTRSTKALDQHKYFSSPGAPSISGPSLAFPLDKDALFSSPEQQEEAQGNQSAAHIVPPVTSRPSPSDGAHRGVEGNGAPLSSSRHPLLLPKPTALVLPGQGSQYVGMSKDLYRSFRAARTIWCEAEEALMASADSYLREFDAKRDVGVDFGWVNGIGGEARVGSRRDFEEALEESRKWDPRLGLSATGTAIARRRRGYLRDLVFSGDQLELTKAENASVSIFTCSMAFLATLKRDFDIDLIKAHIAFASGHGVSGTYSALCASGVLQLTDAVRFLRHRGLICGKYLSEDPRLFPEGCDRPSSVFQTWAFANASSTHAENPSTTDDEFVHQSASRPHWKRTIMCGVVVRPGQLNRMVREIKTVKEQIEKGQVAGLERDEFVDVANFNGERQIVLAGTTHAVTYACERIRSKGYGARAVNLPTSGPYHTSMMKGAQELLLPAINALPLRPPALVHIPKPGEPQPQWTPRVARQMEAGTPALRVISSMDPAGPALDNPSVIRAELRRTMATPVQWAGSVRRLIEEEGVRRFVCVGPGRACAHLLSRELAEYERAKPVPPPLPPALDADGSDLAAATLAANKGGWGFEVWSIATVEDVELLGELMANLNPESTRGLSRVSVQRPAHGSDLYTHEEMMGI